MRDFLIKDLLIEGWNSLARYLCENNYLCFECIEKKELL